MPVKGLIHYALEVPDPVVGQEFYRDFGLKQSDNRGNSLKLQTSRGAGELHLFEGPKKRLHHIAFAAPGDDFEAVREAIKKAGIPEIDPPKDAPQVGIWLHDPFTMYKVFRRDCLAGLTFECNRFDFDWELLIKLIRKGHRPIEIPISYKSRSFKEGKKISMFRDPITWIWALVKFRFRRI